MIKILWLLLIAAWMDSCGYDPSCYDGCDRPKVGEHTTEVTKTVTVVGQPGPAGERGEPGESIQGPRGEPGKDAAPCTVTQVDDGVVVTCNGESVTVLDGTDGIDGADATLPPNTIVDIIPLCGGPEVVLVTEDGTLIAHYSHGNKQYTTVLTPGQYVSTDGEGCRFSVDEENNLTWEDGE